MDNRKGCDGRANKRQDDLDAKLWSDASSTEVRECSTREPQKDRAVSSEVLEGKLEVLTESGEVEQVHVVIQDIPGQGYALMESSGPIPHPLLYSEYPDDMKEVIKKTYIAMAIEPSKREDKYATHAIVMSYMGLFGTVVLFLSCLGLAFYFFAAGNNIAGLAFISANLLGVIAAMFEPILSPFRNRSSRKDSDG